VGSIRVREFISLDGVIDAPTWTFSFGFDPRIAELKEKSAGIEAYGNGVTYLHLTPAPGPG
jgi:hypothetical protein